MPTWRLWEALLGFQKEICSQFSSPVESLSMNLTDSLPQWFNICAWRPLLKLQLHCAWRRPISWTWKGYMHLTFLERELLVVTRFSAQRLEYHWREKSFQSCIVRIRLDIDLVQWKSTLTTATGEWNEAEKSGKLFDDLLDKTLLTRSLELRFSSLHLSLASYFASRA